LLLVEGNVVDPDTGRGGVAMNSTWRWLRGLAGLESGRWCRQCEEAIDGNDLFGMSEGVCRPCRSDA
jgi:hypothetical protein